MKGEHFMTAEQVVQRLQLEPLPGEGGYYRETYRSSERLESSGRSHGTAIYFLITPQQFSALHRLPIDEVWHFYLGDPVEQIRISAEGHLETIILGQDLDAKPAQHLQSLVPAGIWQGTRLITGGRFALLGTTMAPGFEFEDLEMAEAEALEAQFPHFRNEIETFTHAPTRPS